MESRYKLIGDYHTHSIYSSKIGPSKIHAESSMRENAQRALEIGLKELAITDHGPNHYPFGIRKKYIPQMRKEVDRLNEEFNPKGLKILLGLESNIISIDGDIDVDEEIIKELDFLIVGYHYGAKGKTIKDNYWLYFRQALAKIGIGVERSKEIMTNAFIKAVRKNKDINMISHPGAKAAVDIESLAKACSEKDVILELNNYHPFLSVDDIKIIKNIDVRLRVNSDAHHYLNIGQVTSAVKRALAGGLDLSRIENLEII